MGYNKRQFTKLNNKKVLHKVKKRWVVLSLSLLALLGGGAVAYQTAVHADSNDHTQPANPEMALRKRINTSLSKTQSSQNRKIAQINYVHNQPTGISQINQQASNLHNRILQTAINSNPKVDTGSPNSSESSNGRSEIAPSNEVGSTNSIDLGLPNGVIGKLSSDQHTLTVSGDFSNYHSNPNSDGETGTPLSHNLSDVTTLKLGNATNLPSDCEGMFSQMPYLSTVKTVGNWDMSKVSDIADMFYADPMLTDIEGLKDWDVSHVNTAFAMFNDDYSLSNLNPLANWNWLDNHQGHINLGAMFLSDDSIKDWSPIQYHWQFLNNNINSGRMFNSTGVSPDLSLHSNSASHYVFSTPVAQAQATFKFIDWRTGRLVGQSTLSVPTGTYSNYTLGEIGVPSAYHLVNQADGYNPNKPAAGDNYDPQIDVGSTPSQNVFSIPVVPDSVIHYGYWGNAHYELTSTGTLRLFNGDMNTTRTPWIFNQPDAQAGSSFGEHNAPERGYYLNGGDRRRTYGDDVLKIKTSNVVAPESCQGLFGGSSIYFGHPHYQSDIGANSKDGATGHFCNVESVDLSGLDTSGTTNMAGMLRGEYNLTSVKFGGNFDTHKVTNMANMFDDDSDITSLDLNSFDTSKCSNFNGMFFNMGSLRDLDIYNFVINPGTKVKDMFSMSYHKSPSDGNDSSADGERNSIDSSLREIDIGPRTQFTANDNDGLNNKNLFGGKFFNTKTGRFTNEDDHVRPNYTDDGHIHGAWVNVDPNTGQYVSDLSELADVKNHPLHAGNWVYFNDIIPYRINFVDVLNNQPFNKFGPILSIQGWTLRGLENASWVPIDYYNDPNHLPTDRFGIHYRLAPNQGLTVPVTVPNQQINIGVYAPEDVIDANVWGTADWFVFGSDRNNDNAYGESADKARSLYLIDGNMEQDHAPHNTTLNFLGHQTNNLVQYLPYIKQVHATNVEAPTNAAHTFSGQEYNSDSNPNPNFGNEFSNVSDFDLSDFRTQYTSDMDSMFSDLPNLKELDLGNFDTSATYSMKDMFAGDQNLQSLRLTHFIMGENGVTVPTSDMFKSDNDLNSLTIGNHTIFQPNSSLVDHNNWGLTGSSRFGDLTNNSTHQHGTYIRDDNLTSVKINYKFGNTLIASDQYSVPVENGQLNSLDIPMIPNYTFEPSDHPATFTDDDGSIKVPVDEKGKWGDSRWLMNPQGKMLIQEGSLNTNQWNGPVKGQGGSANVNTWPLGKSDVTSITVSDVQAPNDISRIFAGLPKLQSLDLTGLDGIDLDNLSEAFASDPQLSNVQGLYKINPGKHANMSGLLASDPSLQQIDVADMPMGSVDNLSRMFANDTGLQSIDGLNTWLTNSVNNTKQMFNNDTALTDLDLGSFDTRNVSDMSDMLNSDNALQYVTIGSDTRLYAAGGHQGPNLTGQWFNSHNALYPLDNDYDVAQDTNPVADTYHRSSIFSVQVQFRDIETDQIIGHSTISFTSHNDKVMTASDLESQAGFPSGYETYPQDQLNFTISDRGSTTIPVAKDHLLTFGNWNVGDPNSAKFEVFSDGDPSNPSNQQFDPENGKDKLVFTSNGPLDTNSWSEAGYKDSNGTHYVFSSDVQHTDGNSSYPNALNRDSISKIVFNASDQLPVGTNNDVGLFQNMNNLKAIDFNQNPDVSKAQNLSSMFANDGKIKQINLSNWDAPNVTVTSDMFAGDSQLSDLTLPKNGFGQLTDIAGMFSSDHSLQGNEGGINEHAYNPNDAEDASDLHNLDAMDVAKVSDMASAFESDFNLKGLNLASWNASVNLSDMDAMFANDKNLQYLDIHNMSNPNMIIGGANSDFQSDFQNLGQNSAPYTVVMNQKMRLGSDSLLNGYWNSPDYETDPSLFSPRQIDRYGSNLGPNSYATWTKVANNQNDLNTKTEQVDLYNQANNYIGSRIVSIPKKDGSGHYLIDISDQLHGQSMPAGYRLPPKGGHLSDIVNGYLVKTISDTNVQYSDYNHHPRAYLLGYSDNQTLPVTVEYNDDLDPDTHQPIRHPETIQVSGYYGDTNDSVPADDWQPGPGTSYQFDQDKSSDVYGGLVHYNMLGSDNGYQPNDNAEWNIQKGTSSLNPPQPLLYYDDKVNTILKVVYVNQSGRQIGDSDNISGPEGEVVNVTDPSDNGIQIPKGYSLIGGATNVKGNNDDAGVYGTTQDTVYTLNGQSKTVYLHIQGNSDSQAKVRIHQVMTDANGHTITNSSDVDLDQIDGHKVNDGDIVELNPSDSFIRPKDSSYIPDYSKDSVQFAQVNSDGKVEPSDVTFYYRSATTNGAPVAIRYVASDGNGHDHEVGSIQIEQGNIGQKNTIDTSSNSLPHGYQIDISKYGKRINNVIKYPTSYTFTDSPQIVNVPVVGDSYSGTFTIYTNPEGQSSSTHQIAINGKVGDSFTVSPYGFGTNSIMTAIDNKNSSQGGQYQIPSGYHATTSDADLTVYINSDDQLSQSDVTYNYQSNNVNQTSVSTIQIHYVTSDSSIKNDGTRVTLGDKTYYELDNESDSGTNNDTFDLTPYTDDIPETVTQYYDEIDTTSSSDVVDSNNTGISSKNNGYQWKFGASNKPSEIYIKIRKNGNNGDQPIIID